MRTSTGSYIIKPAKPWRESDKEDSLEFSLEHAVQRIKPYTVLDATNDADDRVGAHNCGVIGELVIRIVQVHCLHEVLKRISHPIR